MTIVLSIVSPCDTITIISLFSVLTTLGAQSALSGLHEISTPTEHVFTYNFMTYVIMYYSLICEARNNTRFMWDRLVRNGKYNTNTYIHYAMWVSKARPLWWKLGFFYLSVVLLPFSTPGTGYHSKREHPLKCFFPHQNVFLCYKELVIFSKAVLGPSICSNGW
jgi:hypothetical protein